MISEPFYTAKEAANLYDVAESTIRKYIRNGRLKAEKHGKTWRISSEALAKVFAESFTVPHQQPHDVPHSIPHRVAHDAHLTARSERFGSLETTLLKVRQENERLQAELEHAVKQLSEADSSIQHRSELIEEKDRERERLETQLQQCNEQLLRRDDTICQLQTDLSEQSKRHDTIVLTLSQQLDQANLQLEDMRRHSSWWRRLIGKR